VPITGTATNALGQVVEFEGHFTLARLTVVDGALAAVGQLTGTLTNTVAGAVQNVSQQLILPVTEATCTRTWPTGEPSRLSGGARIMTCE
jgi:hypothetical protein